MKTSCAIFALLLLTAHLSARAQNFTNLNFESTTLSTNGSPGTVSTTIGLPGWTALIGGTPQSTILYNNGTLGNSSIAILGNGNFLNPVIAGGFSASLTAGATGNATISQTGAVPLSASSILFESYSEGNGVPNLAVALNGQTISILPLLTTNNYTLYGGDISAFAGQTASLSFTATSIYPQGFGIFVLDDISFSPTPIPEPTALALMAVGGLLLRCRRPRKSS